MSKPEAWNKGKSPGKMKPLTRKEVRMIKDRLSSDLNDPKSVRDLALFSVAIDTMLRSSDLLALRVENIKGLRITLKQKKTGKSHVAEVSEATLATVQHWVKLSGKKTDDDFLFTGVKKGKDKAISREQYARLVKEWIGFLGKGYDLKEYSTHSLRRTKASILYDKTQNVEAIRQLLGHSSITSTSAYLNVDQNDALKIGRMIDL